MTACRSWLSNRSLTGTFGSACAGVVPAVLPAVGPLPASRLRRRLQRRTDCDRGSWVRYVDFDRAERRRDKFLSRPRLHLGSLRGSSGEHADGRVKEQDADEKDYGEKTRRFPSLAKEGWLRH